MSFRLYCGEYLVSPVPLHFGFNWCSHGCFYCFANLNQPTRRVDMQSLVRMLKKSAAGEADTVESWMLAQGYPVLMANDSDPLAQSNVDVFLSAHDALQAAGVRMCYQTKGGRPEHEQVLLDDEPTLIYISLTSDDEDLLRQAEPGAPGWAHRLDFIRRAKARGHHVVAGLNPLIPWWWDDFGQALAQIKAAGVEHVWCGALHLTSDQIKAMPQAAAQRWATEIAQAKRKSVPNGFAGMVMEMEEAGFNVFEHGTATRPGFWDAYFALGLPFYPTADAFHAHLQAKAQAQGGPVLFGFKHFDAWANIGPMPETSRIKEFLRPFRRTVYNATGVEPKARNLSQINRYYFDISAYPSPLESPALFLASGTGGDGEPFLYTGMDDDLPLLVYAPDHADTGGVFWDIDANPVNAIEE